MSLPHYSQRVTFTWQCCAEEYHFLECTSHQVMLAPGVSRGNSCAASACAELCGFNSVPALHFVVRLTRTILKSASHVLGDACTRYFTWKFVRRKPVRRIMLVEHGYNSLRGCPEHFRNPHHIKIILAPGISRGNTCVASACAEECRSNRPTISFVVT